MKKLLLNFFVVVFSFIFFELKAQNFNVIWGDSFSKKDNVILFVGYDKKTNRPVLIRELNKIEYFLEEVDSNNKVVASKKLEIQKLLGIDPKTRIGISLIFIREKCLLIANMLDKKKKNGIFYAMKISFDDSVIPQPVKIFEADDKTRGETFISVSPDSSKVLWICNVPIQKGREHNIIHSRIFDANFDLIYSKDIDLFEILNDDFRRTRVVVDRPIIENDGKIFFWGYKAGKKGKIAGTGIWSYEPTRELLKEIKFDIKKVKGLYCYKSSNTEDVFVTGFYYTDKYSASSPYGGVFHGKINEQQDEVANIKITEIPVASEHMPKDRDLISKTQNYVDIKDGIILLSEVVYAGGMKIGDVFIAKIMNDGSVKYFTSVSKYQTRLHSLVENLDFYSYYYWYSEKTKTLSLIFNDNPKNLNVINSVKQVYPMLFPNAKKTVAVKVDILDNGKMTKVPLYDNTTSSILLCPSDSYEVSSNQIMLKGVDDNKLVIGSIKLK